VKLGFFADQDRTRYCYLRLRRLKAALGDARALDALLAELEIPAERSGGGSARAKLAAIEQAIDRLRVSPTSAFRDVPAPEVLAAMLFAASTRAGSPVADLFSAARGDRPVLAAVTTWLQGAGLELYDQLPAGTGFDLVGYSKGMLSGARVVGFVVKNDAAGIDAALERTDAFAKYTQSTYVACAPAVAAEYLAARATATGRWDGEALARRLQSSGAGLLLVEGDAVAQVLFPRKRPVDGKALEALIAAFGPSK
jgi:hypothetical protein